MDIFRIDKLPPSFWQELSYPRTFVSKTSTNCATEDGIIEKSMINPGDKTRNEEVNEMW